VVTGLDSAPKSEQPKNLTMLHLAFDIMAGIGTAFIFLGIWLLIGWIRKRDFPQTVWFLRAVAISGGAAVIALESGWIVTEVGRQPWIVYQKMMVSDAVTGAHGLWITFSIVFVVYTGLAIATIMTLRSMARRWRESDGEIELGTPYGPPPPPPPAETGAAA
jgi:cytochrome bd ubiquinol oxidase subunit I